MARRAYVERLFPGELSLSAAQAHHVRDVLRLKAGAALELFDDAGAVAAATIVEASPAAVRVSVASVTPASEARFRWTVASAVPKAARADWMIEKLGELGADAFVPLATARAVVLPDGANKLDRWQRLAAEASRQSRRAGVMRVDPLTDLAELLARGNAGRAAPGAPSPAGRATWYLSTDPAAAPIAGLVREPAPASLTLLIGPEGGWTPAETASFDAAGATGVSLTKTVLRVETAALAAASVVAATWARDAGG